MTIPRHMQIVAEVGHFWDAFDQGRLAHAVGMKRGQNPWDNALSNTHINCSDWYRGWDKESEREKESTP